MRYVLLAGRVLFSLIFINSGITHFQPGIISMGAAEGVPAFLTIGSGLLACAGGLMIALGWRARLGGAFVAAFLIPVTFVMHDFWTFEDPGQRMMQLGNFMKNLSLIGGALAFSYFGSGPLSLDSRRLPRERVEVEVERSLAGVGRR